MHTVSNQCAPPSSQYQFQSLTNATKHELSWDWASLRKYAFKKNTVIAYSRAANNWVNYQLGRESMGLTRLTWTILRQLKTHQIEQIWIDYTIWRYNQYPYESNTIKAELSAINSIYHDHGVMWGMRELMPELKRAFHSIDNINKKCGKTKHRRRPIVDIINYKMIEIMDNDNDKLMFALAQQAMLRSDEYCQTTSENDFLRLKNLTFYPNNNNPNRVQITINSRKNDKHGDPFDIVLKCNCGSEQTTHKHCVVHMLHKRYLKYQYDLEIPVIGSKDPTQPCTNYYANKKLNQACKELNLNPLFYGTHSWRIGKATQLIWEGASINKLMRIGGWASVAAAQLYLRKTNVDLVKFINITPEEYISSLKKKRLRQRKNK